MMEAIAALLWLWLSLTYFCACVLAGMVAQERGRSGALWAVGAFFLLTPVVALLALAGLPIRDSRR